MSTRAARNLELRPVRWSRPEPTWEEMTATAPTLVETMSRYLDDVAGVLKPASVRTTEGVLRLFAGRITTADPSCRSVSSIRRHHVEDYLRWLAARPGPEWGSVVRPSTIAHRAGILITFFERAVSWGYADLPAEIPIRRSDRPKVPRWEPKPQAPTAAEARPKRQPRGNLVAEVTWEEVARRAPQMVTTMGAYLDQLAISARPATVTAAGKVLRLFAGRITAADATCCRVADIERRHIEDYKLWLAARPGNQGRSRLSPNTVRNALGLVRTFFERIVEWDYDDAPARVPIYAGDLPRVDDPLPRFLDDSTAARFMATAATDPNPRRRLAVELLARTGMRVGELAALADDAVVYVGETQWLRIPVGKLHNDRYVPLHPRLVELIADYRTRRGPSRTGYLIERDSGQPLDRCAIKRYVESVARRAGVGHVHPHQLRHTLATQAVNRGMSLEAIAALLGHRSMRMTLTYARISDRTVAEQYFRVTEAVEARYEGSEPAPDPAETASPERADSNHRRLLGNGYCTRPVALDCQFESICERCVFFETGTEFVPILLRQRQHAADHDQPERAALFDDVLSGVEGGSEPSFS